MQDLWQVDYIFLLIILQKEFTKLKVKIVVSVNKKVSTMIDKVGMPILR